MNQNFPTAGHDAKEQVREATDIVDLVSGYVQLRRQGRGYVGLCPWHDDTRPSMQVNPQRQTFKCWVCDIGGDVFSWIMKIDGLEFREALEMLADRANIPLAPPQGGQPQAGSPGDKKTLRAAAAWAEEQFHKCLLNEQVAQPARDYLAERGINAESIARFHLGFAPESWDWLLGKSRGTSFSPQVLERIGLAKARNQGEGFYDFYRGRVMFPIRDLQNRPIAFGGRVLPQFAENAGGKYINSPETPLYSKSNQLYALNLARDGIASEGRAIVVEGYTDVIMAHQYGVENVVAVLGTALTAQHLSLLKRFTDSIALVLDGDEAGQRRTNEVLELFVENQADLRILTLPNGIDPCDFIATPDGAKNVSGPNGSEGTAPHESPTEYGPDAFRKLVDSAPDALEHKMQVVTKGLATTADTHGIDTAVSQLLATLAKMRTRVGDVNSETLVRQDTILARIARRFHLHDDVLRKRLADLRRTHAAKPVRPTQPTQPAQPAMTQAENQASAGADPFAEAAAMDEALHHEDAVRIDASHGPVNAAAPMPMGPMPPREAELLELLLVDEESARRILSTVSPNQIKHPGAARLFAAASEVHDRDGRVDLHRMMDAIEDARLTNLLVKIDEAGQAKRESDTARRISDLLASFDRDTQNADHQSKLSALREGRLDNHQEEAVLSELFASLKSRQAGPPSTEG